MISIKDYANENGVSYEAVRKQMKRYEKELEGHIHKDGRTRFLDDEAVAFLQGHRLKEPVAVYEGSPDAELIAELKEKIRSLEAKNDALTAALIDKGNRLDAANEKLLALAEAKQEEQPQHKGLFAKFFGGKL